MSKIVSLTGLIGSGKSKVGSLFAGIGVPVIDVDIINKNILDKNEFVKQKIINLFGIQYINQNSVLDKEKIRNLIFNDSDARLKLENILHPLIFNEVAMQIKKIQYPYTIVIVPLLFKNNLFLSITDRSLFVDCNQKTLIERVKERSKISEDMINTILKTQIPRTIQIDMADDKIDNNSDEITLLDKVKDLHNKYLNLFSRKL